MGSVVAPGVDAQLESETSGAEWRRRHESRGSIDGWSCCAGTTLVPKCWRQPLVQRRERASWKVRRLPRRPPSSTSHPSQRVARRTGRDARRPRWRLLGEYLTWSCRNVRPGRLFQAWGTCLKPLASSQSHRAAWPTRRSAPSVGCCGSVTVTIQPLTSWVNDSRFGRGQSCRKLLSR